MSRREVRQALKQAAEGNLLERAIAKISPTWAAKRMRSNMFMAMASGYAGGSRARRQTSEWGVTRGNSADADTLFDLPVLRDRSRDLRRNEPLAAGAISGIVTSVVGTGLAYRSRIDREALGMTEEQATAFKKKQELEFNLWFESTACDATRTTNGYGLQSLVLLSWLEAGDVFTFTPMRAIPGCPYQTCLQIIEADQVSNPNGAIDTPKLAGGIEMDDFRAPVRVHLQRSHPGELNKRETVWDAYSVFGQKTGRRQVIHTYERLRPGQTRGVPYLAPVIETLKMLGRYTEAELMAAVISSMFTVFVESERGGLDAADPSGIADETGARASDKDVKLGSGAIIDLNPGEKISFANPQRPNAAFDGFVTSLCRFIGLALELPYEVLIKHFSSSYSASRGALLEAWKFYRKRRALLADGWCNHVLEVWMDEAVSSGRIAAPGYFDDPIMRRAYLGAEWIGDGMISVDPVKDITAAQGRVELGISNIDKEASLWDGGNFEDNHAQLVREHNARQAAGLGQQPAQAAPVSRGSTAPADTADNADNKTNPDGTDTEQN